MEIYSSAAAQIIIATIPIVGIVIGGIVVFFYLLWRHKQVTLQIKMGTYTPAKFDLYIYDLMSGLLLAGIGTVLTILIVLLEGVSYGLLGGLIPLVLGICMLVFSGLYRRCANHRDT